MPVTHGLKKRIDPEDRELRRVQAKLGEVAEARATSQQHSPFTHRRCPLTMVCAS